MYRAVLDTCVLVPSLQRDFLLKLATEGAFSPLWGSGVLTELDYTLATLHAARGVADSNERRCHLFAQMAWAFPGSEIDAPKDRVYDYELDDLNDGHVAHAALIGNADAIVTDDKRAGFKTSTILSEADIEVVFANEFAANTVAAHPKVGVRALVAISARRNSPPQTPDETLDQLISRHGMTEVAGILRAHTTELA